MCRSAWKMLLYSGAAFIIVGDGALVALVGLLSSVIAAVHYSWGNDECAAAVEAVAVE